MTEEELRIEVCRVGQSLFNRGYVHATSGNISVRLPDGFLITPTDACLGFLVPGRLAKVGLNGEQVSGDRASKTLALHRSIYESARWANCVIHTHSTHLVGLTVKETWRVGETIPPLTPYFVMKVGRVPLLPYARPGDPRVGVRVQEQIKTHEEKGVRLRAVMLDALGPNVWEQTPSAAMAALEELEETARLWMLAGDKAVVLSEAELDELRQTFNASW